MTVDLDRERLAGRVASTESQPGGPEPTGRELAVKRLSQDGVAAWDAFVQLHPEATCFHLTGWKTVLEGALGHRTHYLYAEQGGSIRALLPLAEIKSRLFGHALISTPFCVYGGVLATSDAAAETLTTAACELAHELGVDYLELRNRRRRQPGWPCKDLYVTFRKEIASDAEENLKAIPRKQRAMVRKGIAAGLTARRDDDVERFFAAYSESLRNLGTPVLPKRYYRALKETFGEACELLTIERDGLVLASVLSFYFRDEVVPYYGGGTGLARGVAANDFMYWELMRQAGERGVRLFDYGRSKRDVGSYRFKKHWGFEPEPLYYEYHLVRARSVPEVNPLNPRYRLFINAWKRLPLGVSRLLGPLLAKSLG